MIAPFSNPLPFVLVEWSESKQRFRVGNAVKQSAATMLKFQKKQHCGDYVFFGIFPSFEDAKAFVVTLRKIRKLLAEQIVNPDHYVLN